MTVTYEDILAVNGVDVDLDAGELVSVIGANGAGKSSILNGIMGWTPLKAGTVRFNGRDISGLPTHLRARMGIRTVPERSRIFPRLTVLENLLTGLYGLRKTPPADERLAWVHELFPVLKEKQDDRAGTLSGGQQQQLAIARALISAPRLLLVDEVSMGLMPKLAAQVFELLERLNQEHGLSILLVEQNAVASLAISGRAYVLETGVVVRQGPAAALAADPKVRDAYLGTGGGADDES
jgi:branched-chain amino acid transport system ATP-binding protein